MKFPIIKYSILTFAVVGIIFVVWYGVNNNYDHVLIDSPQTKNTTK